MAEVDRQRWNARYDAAGADGARADPRPFLGAAERWLRALPAGARALDLACGPGREARWLAALGFEVDAVDVSDVAIGQARAALAPGSGPGPADGRDEGRVRLVVADLDAGLPAEVLEHRYAVIWAGHFRGRVVEEAIERVLQPGGLVITTRLSAVGREAGAAVGGEPGAAGGRHRPDPAFLAAPGELLALARRHRLEVLHHEEGDGAAGLVARAGHAAGAP